MSDLVLENIGKTYANGYQAIPSIDLTIEEGEFIVLVGLLAVASLLCYAWWQALRASPKGHCRLKGMR